MIAYAHFNMHGIAYRNNRAIKNLTGKRGRLNFPVRAAQAPGKRFLLPIVTDVK